MNIQASAPRLEKNGHDQADGVVLYTLYNVLPAGAYTEAVGKAAEDNQDFVMGFISIAPSAWKSGPGSPGETCYKSPLSWLGDATQSELPLCPCMAPPVRSLGVLSRTAAIARWTILLAPTKSRSVF